MFPQPAAIRISAYRLMDDAFLHYPMLVRSTLDFCRLSRRPREEALCQQPVLSCSRPLLDFYSQAFNGSVILPIAAYDFGGNWTISTGGAHTRWTDD